MSRLFIVVESKDDWSPYFPSEDVITFDEYLLSPYDKKPVRTINLCRSYKYLSKGYYCSLLAESRGDKVIPGLKDLGRLESDRESLSVSLPVSFFTKTLEAKMLKELTGNEFTLISYFGLCDKEWLNKLTRKIFEKYEYPVQELKFVKSGSRWFLDSIKPLTLDNLEGEQEDTFASSLESSISLMWRKPRRRKKYKYDIAILIDPEEKLPPSNKKALNSFVEAGHFLGIESTFITKDDYANVAEYDGLFIRETTAVNNHTFKFAQKAEEEGIIVVDDPSSILKCTNKVFLSDLFNRTGVPTPQTALFSNVSLEIEKVVESIGFPMILKIPDGAFSQGVFKVKSIDELKLKCDELFKRTHLLIAQEYLYTDYDWRIGVFGNKALYACRYYMARGHWQIYNHAGNTTKSGGFETMSVQSVPQSVIKTALNACAGIGDGLYGVDLKQVGDRLAVIEVNDNPSIDAGVEDKWLGKDLYHVIMQEFLMRMERNHYGY
ncbi:MAG: RimK family protein [Lentisphaeraceae bacterium]|nr:RimK family protein [Lentisphaeraceae bacterium]